MCVSCLFEINFNVPLKARASVAIEILSWSLQWNFILKSCSKKKHVFMLQLSNPRPLSFFIWPLTVTISNTFRKINALLCSEKNFHFFFNSRNWKKKEVTSSCTCNSICIYCCCWCCCRRLIMKAFIIIEYANNNSNNAKKTEKKREARAKHGEKKRKEKLKIKMMETNKSWIKRKMRWKKKQTEKTELKSKIG